MEIDLSIDTKSVEKTLVEFIRGEVARAGFARAVVNLSGGLDSAVSCTLAVKALGAENVLAILLPYKTSSQDSIDHAHLLLEQLGAKSLTIPITEMVDAIIAREPEMSPVRQGNIMARTRMIIAYDQSAAFKGLVVGTGNKTEILLGYTTLYGDSACAFNPLGDLYKTRVRQLARALSVPEPIIAKPPTAGLWVGQTDEGELGFTYAEVDKLLFLLVDQHLRPDECVAFGFDESFVRKVLERVKKNQFKRVMPPIAKISDRAVDYSSFTLPEWGK